MTSLHNIKLLLFFFFTNTWTHNHANLNPWKFNMKHGGNVLNNNGYFPFNQNNLHGSEKVRIQLYYESLCPSCRHFEIYEFAPVVETMSSYLNIQTYPFGNAEIVNNNGMPDFQCQHGPAECYGNKLHACALDQLPHTTALLYNACLMNSTNSKGSDDISADRCGYSMNINSIPIKMCAKSTRGSDLLLYYGQESKKAQFSYVPYVLINGEVFKGSDFKRAVCDAFTNPPPSCY